MIVRWVCALGLAAASTAVAAPDEKLLGKASGYPIGNPANWFYDERVRVGSFSHLDAIMRHHVLAKSDAPSAIERGALPPDLRYTFHGRSYSIDDYLDRQRITRLFIAKDARVLVQTAVAKNARISREPMGQELQALWLAPVNEYGRR